MVNKSNKNRRIRTRVGRKLRRKLVTDQAKVVTDLEKLTIATRKTPFADAGGKIGRIIGANWGFGGLGSEAGRWIGSNVGKIFGRGAYSIKQNSKWDSDMQVPVMHTASEDIRLHKREYIGDITITSAYTATTYSINPGMANIFPYLSAVAQNFQEYQFNGLVFEFKSTASDDTNTTNTNLGSVMMCAMYQSDAAAPANKEEMLNEMWCMDTRPCNNGYLPIECDPKENPLRIQYVRTAPLSANKDVKLYDLASLVVATQGAGNSNIVGELWATYDVTLKKPRLASTQLITGQSMNINATTGIATTTKYFGTDTTTVSSSFESTPVFGNTTITIPANVTGTYQLVYWVFGSSGAWTGPTVTLTTNCTAHSTLNRVPTNFQTAPNGGSTATQWMGLYVFDITQSNVATVITFSSGTYVSPTQMVCTLTQVPSTF